MKILVSACLLGENCKYNGSNNYHRKVADFVKGHQVTAVCPEVLGGLPVPRTPAEIAGGAVINAGHISVDGEFRKGAALALKQALDAQIDMVILQPRSPSCGLHQIYDGSFSGKLVEGQGIFARLLKEAGIKAIEADELPLSPDEITGQDPLVAPAKEASGSAGIVTSS